MADPNNIFKDNIIGLFYVDKECIACDACVIDATSFFSMNNNDSHAYVAKQPITIDQIQTCNEALDNCPVEAIGKNKPSK